MSDEGDGRDDPWYADFARHVELRRDRRELLAPAVRRARDATLDFTREAAWYERHVLPRRRPADRRLIARLAGALTLPAGTRTITAIPVLALERDLARTLACYRGARRDHAFVLLINGSPARCDRDRFAREVARLRAEIAASRDGAGATTVVLVHYFARPASIRKIRGLLTDAIVVAARRARLADPVVISNDADQRAASADYLARIRRHFATTPGLDFVSGPVLFDVEVGASRPARRGGTSAGGDRLPELWLSNRFIQACHAARRAGDGVPAHFVTQGASTAFRLAALCAAGGLDYQLWEDRQIGWWTAAMRLAPGAPAGYAPAHHRFDDALVVVTDPRRVLRAVVHGKVASQAWTWEGYDDAPVIAATATLGARYRRRRGLLQLDDVRAAAAGDVAATRKTLARIVDHFFASLHPSSAAWVAAVAARYGLCFVAPPALRGESSVQIRWRESSVLTDLLAWAAG